MLYARVVEGSFTMIRFRSFLEGCLEQMDENVPLGSHIIMDNARIHHDPSIIKLIEGRGYHIMYLPPYSPELAFSSIKAFVC